MRLKVALALSALVSFAVVLVMLWSTLDRSVATGYQTLASGQLENVRSIVQQSVEQKRKYLGHVTQLIQSDAHIAGTYVLAKASRDYNQLSGLLQDIKSKTGLDALFIQDISENADSPMIESDFAPCWQELKAHLGELFCSTAKGVALVRASELSLYGEKAGYLFLAQLLIDPGAQALSAAHDRVEFVLQPIQGVAPIAKAGTSAVYAQIVPNYENIKSVTENLRQSVLLGAALALSVLLLLIIFVGDWAFLRPYLQTVEGLNKIAIGLESDHISDLPKVKDVGIYENRVLVSAIRIFVDKMRDYEKRLTASLKVSANLERQAAIGQLAGQVAHDIRSPLSAIRLTVAAAKQLPSEQAELLKSAADRISLIAEDLLKKYRSTQKEELVTGQATHLMVELDRMLSEKRIEHQKLGVVLDFLPEPNALFVHSGIPGPGLGVMISNLLNNAIEASRPSAKVLVTLSQHNQLARIQIIDHGSGIPPHVLAKLGKEEITYGKVNGNGLGVRAAFKIVEEQGGHITVESQLGQGTQVDIYLPLAPAPKWLATDFMLDTKREIILIDDDRSVHDMWRLKLSDLAYAETVFARHYLTTDDFLEWVRHEKDLSQYQFLVDYDLGAGPQAKLKTGLDLIAQTKINVQSVLVTGRSLDADILAQALKVGVKILPKALMAYL